MPRVILIVVCAFLGTLLGLSVGLRLISEGSSTSVNLWIGFLVAPLLGTVLGFAIPVIALKMFGPRDPPPRRPGL